MKTILAAAAACALALATSSAVAQHQPQQQKHVRPVPRVSSQTYGFTPRQPLEGYSRSDVFQSDAQGRQSYPNPDRVLPVPDHE